MTTTEVGVGYVRLLPSMEGFAAAARRELGSALTGPARDAGRDAGQEMGKGLGDGIDGSAGKLDRSVGKIGKLFKVGLAAAGVAAGALMAVGISGALEQGVATDRLSAQLGGGALGEEAGKVAGRLYTQAFGDSVADTGAAVRRVIQNGLLPEGATVAQIESLTAKVLTFSDVMEQDLDMATQAVASMLTSGIADTAEEALDVMTRAIQGGADKAGDLASVFQEYGTSFREAGLTAADAAGLMTQGLSAGARDADKVADALKEFGIRAQDGSKLTAEGFAMIGLNAEEMQAAVAAGGEGARDALGDVLDGLRGIEDPALRNAAAVALFGTQAEDLGDALFALDLDTAAGGLGELSGATDGLGSAYDNAATKIEAFKRQGMQKLIEFVGGTVIPGIERLAAVMGPPLTSVISAVSPYVTELVSGFTTLRAAFDTGDDFGVGGWSDITGVLANVGVILHGLWTQAQDLLPKVQELFSAVFDFLRTLITTWVQVVTVAWGLFGDDIMAVARIAFNLITGIISGALDIITGLFRFATALLTGDWSGAWDAIKQILSGAWTIIQSLFVAGFGLLRVAVGLGWSVIKALFGLALDAAKQLVLAGLDAVVAYFRNLPGRVSAAFSTLARAITSPFSSAFGSIKKLWNDTLGNLSFSIPKWVPSIGGNKFSLPKMHTGGVFQSGSGPRNEGLALLQNGEGVFTREQMMALGGAARSPAQAASSVVISADGDQHFLAWLRHSVRVQGGGNVQVALGR